MFIGGLFFSKRYVIFKIETRSSLPSFLLRRGIKGENLSKFLFKNPPPAPSKGGISISLRGMFIGGLFLANVMSFSKLKPEAVYQFPPSEGD
jgi:hypothetical protein